MRDSVSGVTFCQDYEDYNFRSHVHSKPTLDCESLIDKRLRRFMGVGVQWSYVAMKQAIEDAKLSLEEVSHEKTGVIVGSGGASTANLHDAHQIMGARKSTRKLKPWLVPRTMTSSAAANLSTAFRVKGVSYAISSACSTSAHCIGSAMELIQWGGQDIVFAGGVEEVHWTMSCMFDAMGALSSNYNDRPAVASRAFDVGRDGFIIAGGAGILVLEELERAKARGATIYAEITGYGANSDGADMVAPSGEGAVRCMKLAIEKSRGRRVDYINAHGTSTPVGDAKEVEAIKEVFGDKVPHISSTKSLTGHSLGAAGAQEAIYSLFMLKNGFVAASANIDNLMPEAQDLPIARKSFDFPEMDTVMSNSFGFGGTNATLMFSKLD
jgi:3-oxoacyl-[acyl-carrier-protein] synthase-1